MMSLTGGARDVDDAFLAAASRAVILLGPGTAECRPDVHGGLPEVTALRLGQLALGTDCPIHRGEEGDQIAAGRRIVGGVVVPKERQGPTAGREFESP
jgi:hypothetical protein